MSDETNEDVYNDNAYVNQLTLNFLISKTQLNKLNKLKQKDAVSEPTYDKDRIYKLFNQLLNNDKPYDLLEDVKVCFDAFVEKSIYYLEIHDKNESIQNERIWEVADEDVLAKAVEEDINYDKEYDDDDDDDEDDDVEDDFNDNEDDDVVAHAVVAHAVVAHAVEPVIVKKINTKYSKKNISNGVDDIHKLPLDWFNTTRQNYKQNQIIPRKKEIIIDNSSSKKYNL
jgi:hypothetical protein